MDKELLIKILAQNNRVVIPSLGAFLRKQQGDVLIFSPFLKNDDGFLTSAVRIEYGISLSDAESMVAAFAAHVHSVLTAKSKFYIDGVGTLIVDDNGATSFIVDEPKTVAPAPQAAPLPSIEPQSIQQMAQPVQPIAQPVAQPVAQTIAQPVAPQPITPQPIAPQPIAPTPTVAPRPAFSQSGMARPVQSGNGNFARPTPVAPIAQSAAMAAPVAAPVATAKPAVAAPAAANTAQPQQNRPIQGVGSTGPRRNVAPHRKKGGKNDVWLIIAIIAALIVITLMVVGMMTAQEANLQI